MKILMTGITGFLGTCFYEVVKQYPEIELIGLSRKDWDFRQPMPQAMLARYRDWGAPCFIHAGAAVHALRSLNEPELFVDANILGTFHALEAARQIQPKLFVYISSGEVLGEKDEGYSAESDPLKPSNPYSATKAAGELLTQSYFRCFGLPSIVVRTMNLFDMDTQADETKFVPMVKKAVASGQVMKIHVRNGKPGIRQWMTGPTFAKELIALLPVAEPGEIYHLVGEELSNVEMAQRVADHLRKPLQVQFERISNTHAWRYAMQRTK